MARKKTIPDGDDALLEEVGTSDNPRQYVHQRSKVKNSFKINELPWTERQKEIIKTGLDKNTKIVLLKGSAGTSKTCLGMYMGLKLLGDKKVSEIVMVRSAVESSDSKLGFLPGDLAQKFNVYLTPFNDKLKELLSTKTIENLEADSRLQICPINFARGRHFPVTFVICDEAQNLTFNELHTLMTRLGKFSTLVIAGDPDQSDLPKHKSGGFQKVWDMFNTESDREMGIHCLELSEDHCMRSEICSHVIKKFKHELNVEKERIDMEKNEEYYKRKSKNPHFQPEYIYVMPQTSEVDWTPKPLKKE